MELIDQGAIIDGLQKVANRVALGLVMAALIVSAALIMQVPTTFRLLGYPALAIDSVCPRRWRRRRIGRPNHQP
jgi:ubiquinone biosynthesis protein